MQQPPCQALPDCLTDSQWRFAVLFCGTRATATAEDGDGDRVADHKGGLPRTGTPCLEDTRLRSPAIRAGARLPSRPVTGPPLALRRSNTAATSSATRSTMKAMRRRAGGKFSFFTLPGQSCLRWASLLSFFARASPSGRFRLQTRLQTRPTQSHRPTMAASLRLARTAVAILVVALTGSTWASRPRFSDTA